MTSQEFTHQAASLFKEKGWDCTPEVLSNFQQVCNRLSERGIRVDREMLEFVLDVVYVKRLIGLTAESTDEEIEEAKEPMIEWLEALGWRRAWFLRIPCKMR